MYNCFMRLNHLILTIGFLVVSPIAYAISYDTQSLNYSDRSQFSAEEATAISVLSNAEVLFGNPDGTFNVRSSLNRAEFITIAMRLMEDSDIQFDLECFPDVRPFIWYAASVCEAKALGIVSGNKDLELPPEGWLFEPSRSVQYEEALKVLTNIYGLSSGAEEDSSTNWYDEYVRLSEDFDIDLKDAKPGDSLTRGQMARLTANYFASSRGELNLLRGIETQSSSSSSVSSVNSSIQSSSSSVSSSSVSVTYDTHESTDITRNFVLLGEVSSILGSVSIFSNAEPINVDRISIILSNSVNSIDSLLVYDENSVFIGRATLDYSISGGKTYVLSIRTNPINLSKRESFSIYVRGRAKSYDSGGVSGEIFSVSSVKVEGDGEWSNNPYSETLTDSFPEFQTSRSVILFAANADDQNGFLISGSSQNIGSFTLGGRITDGNADIDISKLTFQIESAGGVSISNVQLGADGTNDRLDCSIASTEVICDGISSALGSLEDSDREITLYGDVSVPQTIGNKSLRLTLNQTGSIGSPGSVIWTDGTTTFDWVSLPNPVARGTYFTQ
jgi:hypothetical protein